MGHRLRAALHSFSHETEKEGRLLSIQIWKRRPVLYKVHLMCKSLPGLHLGSRASGRPITIGIWHSYSSHLYVLRLTSITGQLYAME